MLAATALLLAPASTAASAAVDEYAIGISGGGQEVTQDVQRDPNADEDAGGGQLGVVGETAQPQTPLQAAGPVAWAALAIAVGGGVAAFTLRRRPPGPT